MGHEDGLALFDTSDGEKLLKIAAGFGPKIAILKIAEHGALGLANDHIFEVPAYPVKEIIDPVGAGDGFDAGFLAGWLRGWDIKNAVKLGAKIGALAVTQTGDYHGYPNELETIEKLFEDKEK
jgi:2-dehydro-3-deoxygluconokinase